MTNPFTESAYYIMLMAIGKRDNCIDISWPIAKSIFLSKKHTEVSIKINSRKKYLWYISWYINTPRYLKC